MLLSYCVVNTNGRDYLAACLDAIERTHPSHLEHELLVLDNASDDGSAAAVRERYPQARVIALERRANKAENDSTLLREARGRYGLLLNEDSELQAGAVEALMRALEPDPRTAAAVAQLLDSTGHPRPCAWRLPTLGTALAGALFLHRWLTVQSGGQAVREVEWVQSSAVLVRRSAAEQIGFFDPRFFYSEELDFFKRLRDAGWRTLYVPAARAIHHGQMGGPLPGARRRIVEFHRGRDQYMRKHHGRLAALVFRPLAAFPYALRALAATLLPGHEPRRYLLHARQALLPASGEGIREALAERNPRHESARV